MSTFESENTTCAKRQEKVTHSQKEKINQETNPEMTENETSIQKCSMLKYMSIMRRKNGRHLKNQVKLLEVKNIISKMKKVIG